MSNMPSILTNLPQGEALKKAHELGPDGIIDALKQSGLRGRGGAGFPTGLKWEFTHNANGDVKYVVCNADEGEVGTFKDRKLIIEEFDKLLEGMAIAAYTIGAAKAIIYLRWEYRYLNDSLKEKIASFTDVFSTVPFEIHNGAGAYVCGEETALLDSLEGKRGEARNKPPYPVNEGYLGKPTLLSNVETFCCVPHILLEGADKFASVGTAQSKGPKLFSVSGDVSSPGVVEFPLGTPLQEILSAVGGTDAKAALVGGASGIMVTSEEFNRKLAYEDLPPGGSIVVFNKIRNMADVLENLLEFFVEESCSQCTPCREGTNRLLKYVQKIKKEGVTDRRELRIYYDLAETMKLASKCGLGQSAPNPFLSIMDAYRDDFVSIKQ